MPATSFRSREHPGRMGEGVIFREEQRVRQWWIWAMVLGIAIVTYCAAYVQLVQGIPFGDNPGPDWVVILVLIGAGVLLPLFIGSIKLTTEVRRDGLFMRFRPFHRRFKDMRLDDAIDAKTIQYRPLRDFGGWGIRFGDLGTAYTISGRWGLVISYPGKEQVLIGTLRPQELEKAVALIHKKG